MSRTRGGKEEANVELPAAAVLAAERAGLAGPVRAYVTGFGTGDGAPGEEERKAQETGRALRGLSAAWAERRHVIVRSGPRLSASDAAAILHEAGVHAETPALLASGLGTGRERLLYGSLDDVRRSRFGVGAVLLVLHPAALTIDFAWPPPAAPEGEEIG